MDGTERRRTERRPTGVRVTFRDGHESFAQEYAINISQQGLFIKTLYPKEKGDIINMTFSPPYGVSSRGPGKSIRGEVLWVNNDPARGQVGMGVRFLELDEEKKAEVLRFILECQATQDGY